MTENNLSSNGYNGPNLMTHAPSNVQSGCYVDAQFRLWACKHQAGSDDWEKFDLGTIPGNPLASPIANDAHFSPAWGVDADGRNYVVRHDQRDPTCRLMRSTTPFSITDWVPIGGQLWDTSTMWHSYDYFAQFSDGELLLRHSTREQKSASSLPGYVSMYVMEKGKSIFTNRGIVAAGTLGTQDQFYAGYPMIDADDVVHLFGVWRRWIAPGTPLAITGHSYMRSRDRCRTWEAVDGTPLSKPVLRTNASGVKCRTGIDFGDSANLYAFACAVDGINPACTFLKLTDPTKGTHIVRWNGSRWVDDTTVTRRYVTAQSLVTVNGRLWVLGGQGPNNLVEARQLLSPNEAHYLGGPVDNSTGPNVQFPSQRFCAPDPVAARLGRIEVMLTHGDRPDVVSFAP